MPCIGQEVALFLRLISFFVMLPNIWVNCRPESKFEHLLFLDDTPSAEMTTLADKAVHDHIAQFCRTEIDLTIDSSAECSKDLLNGSFHDVHCAPTQIEA